MLSPILVGCATTRETSRRRSSIFLSRTSIIHRVLIPFRGSVLTMSRLSYGRRLSHFLKRQLTCSMFGTYSLPRGLVWRGNVCLSKYYFSKGLGWGLVVGEV